MRKPRGDLSGGAPRVAVVGAGWAGGTAARLLHDAGCRVHLFEAAQVIGGHSRTAFVNGVMYEPDGPHIFHSSDPAVVEFAKRFGMNRDFAHRVFTEVYLDEDDDGSHVLAWPPQVDELKRLPIWGSIEKELAELPETPSHTDLESYCISIMGATLYRLFIEGYSVKQWGRHPAELSSSFAPGRLELRTDSDNTRLFRDDWEFFVKDGAQSVIENMTRPIPATFGEAVGHTHLEELEKQFDALVVTAPLDDFAGRHGWLEWRGIRTVSKYIPLDDPAGTVTRGYVVNQPSLRRPYTRTVETKHASAQRVLGTVVSEEYPGAPARHYPVLTVSARNEKRNAELQREIKAITRMHVYFCGRLANYTYINQDVAIAQGMATAREVMAHFEGRPLDTAGSR